MQVRRWAGRLLLVGLVALVALAGLVVLRPVVASAAVPANGVKDVTSSMTTSSFVPGFTLAASPGLWRGLQPGSVDGLAIDPSCTAQSGWFDVTADGTTLSRFDLTGLGFVDTTTNASDFDLTITGRKAGGGTVTGTIQYRGTGYGAPSGGWTSFTGLTGFRLDVVDIWGLNSVCGEVFDTFTIGNATGPASSISTLSALTLGSGTLSPAFAAGTTSYSASVANGTTSVSVTPTATDPAAGVRVNGSTVASGSPALLPLAVGSNTVSVAVTAPDGSTTRTYTVVITRAAPSSTATLSGLTTSAGTLSPAFAAGTTSYAVAVGHTTGALQVTPTPTDPGATVTVDGITVPGGTASSSITLPVGTTTVTVVVTAPDGTTTQTYTLAVTRPSSTDASLSALTVSAGSLSPSFASGTTGYAVAVGNATSSITVTPTAADAGATVQVGGATTTSGTPSAAITLPVGTTSVPVAVTAQDGTTTRTYTLTVTRAASSDASLAGLVLAGGTLDQPFAPGTTGYTATVPFSTTSVTLTPTVADAGAGVTVAGAQVTSGSASAPLPLTAGSNPIAVAVAAADGTTRTYTVTITRQPASAAASLSALATSAGALSPTFARSTTAYAVTVAYPVSSVTVTPTVADPGASVTVDGTAVTSGNSSATRPLVVGTTTLVVVVTAQDGTTTTTYTLTVTRLASSDATLSGLQVSGGALTPAFAPGTTTYSVAVPAGTGSTTVTPTAADPAATITVQSVPVASGAPSAAVPLAVGQNQLVVRVTAGDGTFADYVLTVDRAGAAPSFDDDRIGDLQVGTAVDDAVHAVGSPVITYTLTGGVLPLGLVLDGTTGAVRGTPVLALPYDLRITATNAYGSAVATVTGAVRAVPAPVLRVTSTLQAGQGAAGQQVSVTVLAMVPGSTVVLTLHSTPVVLFTGTVGANGTLGTTVALPAGIEPGAHRIEVEATAPDGSVTRQTLWFSVLADGSVGTVSADGPVDGTAAPALARTGPAVDVAGAVVVGLLLLVAGAVLSRTRRRA